MASSSSVAPSKLSDRLSDMVETITRAIHQRRAWTVPPQLAPTLQALGGYLAEGGDPLVAMVTLHDSPKDWLVVNLVSSTVFALKVGVNLRYGSSQLVELGTAALLHDVGLLNEEIYEAVNTDSPLDKQAMTLSRQHPLWGRELLEGQGLVDVVLNAVEQHHEQFNGQGYPHKLAGDKIHPYAMVIGLCDAYEALIHRRPYRPTRMMPAQAVRLLKESGKDSYDPIILEAFFKQFPTYPVGSFVMLSTGEFAKVVEASATDPNRPWIEIFRDDKGERPTLPKTINLTEQVDIVIKEAIG